MDPYEDPLLRLLRPLAGVLVATFLNVLVAALIGGALPFDYAGRAWSYTALVLYLIVGAVLLFRLTATAERRRFTPASVLTWMLSIWLWPALLLARRSRRD